jgi:hypothetical protein
MHFLLPICGKFTRALLAHQIFSDKTIFRVVATLSLTPGSKFLICAQVAYIRNLSFRFTKPFYLPHMEYEGSIGLVMRKMKKIFR